MRSHRAPDAVGVQYYGREPESGWLSRWLRETLTARETEARRTNEFYVLAGDPAHLGSRDRAAHYRELDGSRAQAALLDLGVEIDDLGEGRQGGWALPGLWVDVYLDGREPGTPLVMEADVTPSPTADAKDVAKALQALADLATDLGARLWSPDDGYLDGDNIGHRADVLAADAGG